MDLLLMLLVSLGTAVFALLAARSADALPRYKAEAELKSAGSIAGVVSFAGEAPSPRAIEVGTKDKACSEEPVPDESLVVSKDGKVQWAVVSIKKIATGKPFDSGTKENPAVLNQKGCRFRPHVVVVPVGQDLKILNSDGILHNVHVQARRNRAKNIAMMGSKKEMSLRFSRPERMKVKCDIHPWMSAWIIAASHPYNVVTDAGGSFRLDSVPPGTYSLEVWHEKLGKVTREVTVASGKEARADFSFPKS